MFTIVGLHDSGLTCLVHINEKTLNEAIDHFKKLDCGCILAIFLGFQLNIWDQAKIVKTGASNENRNCRD